MTECRRCSRKSALFICHTCIENLRQQLRDLPWWLDRLAEAAVGQVKLSDGGRRAKRSSTLHGDDLLAAHIEPYRACKCEEGQCACDTRKARRNREYDALAHILAAGRANARASDELQKIHNTLTRWIQDVCETRGENTPTLHSAHGMAKWLAQHAHAVAGQQDAEQCCDDIAVIVKRAERIVNRPVPPRYLGPCTTDPAPEELLTKRDSGITRCNFALTSKRDAREVKCPQCHITHNIDELLERQIEDTNDKSFSLSELTRTILPAVGLSIPLRTMQHWATTGRMVPTGYGIDGEPRYLLGEIRRLREEKPQKRATGAAARRKVG